MADDMIKLGVLWKNVSRNGNKPYLSGRVQQENLDAAVERIRNGGRLLILGNNKRPEKNDPDCILFVVPEQERQPGNHSGAPPARTSNQPSGGTRGNYQGRPSRSGGR